MALSSCLGICDDGHIVVVKRSPIYCLLDGAQILWLLEVLKNVKSLLLILDSNKRTSKRQLIASSVICQNMGKK